MKKQIFYLGALLLVFISCEKEALEPEIQEAQFQTEINAQKQGQKVLSFKAHLTGDQEVPPVMTDATGQAIFKLSKDGDELHYKLIVANIENVFGAHIHDAPAGQNSGVVVGLYGGPTQGRTDGILAEGIITADDLGGESLESLVQLMTSGGAYVNVHTSQNRGGEIRGQISANNSK